MPGARGATGPAGIRGAPGDAGRAGESGLTGARVSVTHTCQSKCLYQMCNGFSDCLISEPNIACVL